MSKVIIIAEAGVNHNGNLAIAKKLIDAAAEAGADYVKFQTFKAEKLVSINAKKADYQIRNIKDSDNSQFKMLKKLELTKKMHYELISYCKKKQIAFLSTGFDEENIDFLENLGISIFKIPSGEITNKPFLQHIARKKKLVILSSGMSTLEEINKAIDVLKKEGLKKSQIIVLHCNSEYPTPYEDVNLRAMLTIKEALKIAVGYSDHTLGIEVPIAAVALGAQVIEKHFTIDRSLDGPDHKSSLEPNELKEMVSAIRNIEKTLGSSIKEPSTSEKKNIKLARRSLYYSKNLKKGSTLKLTDIITLRPANGVSPMDVDNYIGKVLNNNVKKLELLNPKHFIYGNKDI
jgi:N,N'-diacetyllegionaminate synthase